MRNTNYATSNGKRMIPFLLYPSLSPLFFGGVQAYECKPTLNREAHGQFGSKGDVISLVDYKDVQGSMDTKDLGARKDIDMYLTGFNPMDTVNTQLIDWASIKTVNVFINDLDPTRTKVESSRLVMEADFQPSYTANLEGVETARYDFTALRELQFPDSEIGYIAFIADGTTKEFDLGEETRTLFHEDLEFTKVLTVTVDGNKITFKEANAL